MTVRYDQRREVYGILKSYKNAFVLWLVFGETFFGLVFLFLNYLHETVISKVDLKGARDASSAFIMSLTSCTFCAR